MVVKQLIAGCFDSQENLGHVFRLIILTNEYLAQVPTSYSTYMHKPLPNFHPNNAAVMGYASSDADFLSCATDCSDFAEDYASFAVCSSKTPAYFPGYSVVVAVPDPAMDASEHACWATPCPVASAAASNKASPAPQASR